MTYQYPIGNGSGDGNGDSSHFGNGDGYGDGYYYGDTDGNGFGDDDGLSTISSSIRRR